MLHRKPIIVIFFSFLMLLVSVLELAGSEKESKWVGPEPIESGQIAFSQIEPKAIEPKPIGSEWIELETRYTVIRYHSVETLKQFHQSIHFGNGWWATSTSFDQLSVEENRKISQMKIDAIFKRVQEILDMESKFKKVIINLYPDKKKLESAYKNTYKTQCPFKAWYDFKTNTISLNADDCSEGMFAHEIAHSVIDNFLKIRPPKNTAEILARYVDTHLK